MINVLLKIFFVLSIFTIFCISGQIALFAENWCNNVFVGSTIFGLSLGIFSTVIANIWSYISQFIQNHITFN